MKKTFKELLLEFNACEPAITWAEDRTIEQIVNDCHRGDWLLWLAQKIDLPLNKLTLAKARCAKTVIHLMKDPISINAVNIAEKFGLDECTLEELNIARDKSSSVVTYAAAYAYAAAADAADYVAYVAADAAAADAAYVAAVAAYAAAYAYAADYVAYVAYAAADDVKSKNQKETASICRDILGLLIIDRVNKLLNS